MTACVGQFFVLSVLCCIASFLVISNAEMHDLDTVLKENAKREGDFLDYDDEAFEDFLFDGDDSPAEGNLHFAPRTMYDLNKTIKIRVFNLQLEAIFTFYRSNNQSVLESNSSW